MSTERTFFFRFSQSSALAWEPPTDVLDLGEAILVRLEVAGLLAEDLSIELYGQDLWIRGRRREPEEKNIGYYTWKFIMDFRQKGSTYLAVLTLAALRPLCGKVIWRLRSPR